MNNTPDVYVARLLEITNSKYDYLKKILELTKEQANCINKDEVKKLEDIIEVKQQIIEKINKLDDEFEVYFRRLKFEAKIKTMEELRDQNISGIKELKDSVSLVMDILNQLSSLDNSNRSDAKKLMSKIGSEIKKVNIGKKAYTAYNPQSDQSPSYFIDKKK
ncbi:MAG: flagellar protein FlgN [Bacillota bacterium]|nr:flagellar protein FlgN [Bacillota bacterium]